MNLKKSVLFGALLWVLIFFEFSILMFGFNLQTPRIYYIHYIAEIFLVGLVSYFYFKGSKTKGAGEGLFLGIVFVVVGMILDAAITVPLFVKTYSFFTDVYLWIGIIETILITTIVGAIKKK